MLCVCIHTHYTHITLCVCAYKQADDFESKPFTLCTAEVIIFLPKFSDILHIIHECIMYRLHTHVPRCMHQFLTRIKLYLLCLWTEVAS